MDNDPFTASQVLFLRAYVADASGQPLSHLMKRLADYISFRPPALESASEGRTVHRNERGYTEELERRARELTSLSQTFERWIAENPKLDQLGLFERLLDQLAILMAEGRQWRRNHPSATKDGLARGHWMRELLDQNESLYNDLKTAIQRPRRATEETLRAELHDLRQRLQEAERRAAAAPTTPPPPVSELDEIMAAFPQEERLDLAAALKRENFVDDDERVVAFHRKQREQRGDTPEKIEHSVNRLRENLKSIHDRHARSRKII